MKALRDSILEKLDIDSVRLTGQGIPYELGINAVVQFLESQGFERLSIPLEKEFKRCYKAMFNVINDTFDKGYTIKLWSDGRYELDFWDTTNESISNDNPAYKIFWGFIAAPIVEKDLHIHKYWPANRRLTDKKEKYYTNVKDFIEDTNKQFEF